MAVNTYRFAVCPIRPVVTICDSERVIWTGTYRDFERQQFNALSVAEWCTLGQTGTLEVGGGTLPHYRVTLSKPLI